MVEETPRSEAVGLAESKAVGSDTRMVNEEELMAAKPVAEPVAAEPEPTEEEAAPAPAPQEDAKPDNNNGVRTEKNDEDEVVLRWR